MYSILLIEDNEYIIKGIKYLLEANNFKVTVANLLEANNFKVTVASTLNGAKTLIENKYDLIILDLMLPDGDGLDFYEEYLKNKATLVLTAKDDEDIISSSLDSGIEDYIIKPFRSKELLARINKILKRNKDNEIITVGNVSVDTEAGRVFVDNNEINLTSLEYRVLLLLFQNLNRIVTRDILIDRIWDITHKYVEDNTLTVYIKRIREKLGNDDIIKTIKGIGYRVDK